MATATLGLPIPSRIQINPKDILLAAFPRGLLLPLGLAKRPPMVNRPLRRLTAPTLPGPRAYPVLPVNATSGDNFNN